MENYIYPLACLFFIIILVLVFHLWEQGVQIKKSKVSLNSALSQALYWNRMFKQEEEWTRELQSKLLSLEVKECNLKSAFEKSHDTIRVPIFYSMIPNEYDVEKFNEAMGKQKISSKDLVDFLYLWGRT